jgi:hypothetical protein
MHLSGLGWGAPKPEQVQGVHTEPRMTGMVVAARSSSRNFMLASPVPVGRRIKRRRRGDRRRQPRPWRSVTSFPPDSVGEHGSDRRYRPCIDSDPWSFSFYRPFWTYSTALCHTASSHPSPKKLRRAACHARFLRQSPEAASLELRLAGGFRANGMGTGRTGRASETMNLRAARPSCASGCAAAEFALCDRRAQDAVHC